MEMILKALVRLILIPVAVWVIQLIIALAQGIWEGLLWVAFGWVGFIAGIAGYVIVLCSIKGYKLLGRHISKKGIVICVIFSMLMILAAEYVSTGITIYQILIDDYSITFMDAMEMVPEVLKASDNRNQLLKNLVVGYGLAVWASFSFVKRSWREIEIEDNKQHEKNTAEPWEREPER